MIVQYLDLILRCQPWLQWPWTFPCTVICTWSWTWGIRSLIRKAVKCWQWLGGWVWWEGVKDRYQGGEEDLEVLERVELQSKLIWGKVDLNKTYSCLKQFLCIPRSFWCLKNCAVLHLWCCHFFFFFFVIGRTHIVHIKLFLIWKISPMQCFLHRIRVNIMQVWVI